MTGFFADYVTEGSSPLTRGALGGTPGELLDLWIIPAYAGCTHRNYPNACHLKDHPRLRGVHDLLRLVQAFSVGSSPLTRGALD
ncbi:hypothetical protein HMPREF1531_01132, partial [Propionibacterium sp. oral taxon 192 str. F0372]